MNFNEIGVEVINWMELALNRGRRTLVDIPISSWLCCVNLETIWNNISCIYSQFKVSIVLYFLSTFLLLEWWTSHAVRMNDSMSSF